METGKINVPRKATFLKAALSCGYNMVKVQAHTIDQLKERCLRGERSAQYELFKRFGPPLLTLCRRYARDDQQAEDFFQDAFLRIFDKMHTFKGEGSFEGWMRRVMVTTCLNHLQKSSSKNEKNVLDDLPEGSHNPAIFSRLAEEELLVLVQQLPTGYRTVFNLFAIEGFSHQEIATELSITEGTSRSQLAKARRMLQAAIQELYKIADQ